MKTLFEPVTTEMAPEASRPALERIRKQYGYVPNLLATLANSPATLDGYLSLDTSWSRGTLSGIERQIVLLTVSVANGCSYCEAAHAAGAAMLKASPAVIEAIRSSRPIPDTRLAALAGLTREIVIERGHASPTTIESFLAAGYIAPQILEVIAGVALKTLSNYLHHISPVPVDAGLRAFVRAAA